MKRDVSLGGMSDSSIAVCITRMRLKHFETTPRMPRSWDVRMMCCNHSTNSPCSPVSQHVFPSTLQNNHSAAVEPHCSATWLRNKQEQLIGNLSDIISELFFWPSQQAYFWHLLTLTPQTMGGRDRSETATYDPCCFVIIWKRSVQNSYTASTRLVVWIVWIASEQWNNWAVGHNETIWNNSIQFPTHRSSM